jgi:hypothetical protein
LVSWIIISYASRCLWCDSGPLECTKYTLSPRHCYALIYNNALIAVEDNAQRNVLLLDDQSMQLAGRVRTGFLPPIRFTRTWASATSIPATIAEADHGNAPTINHQVAQRSTQPSTTVDTGLRREEVGGIIIGVCVGLILLLFLFCICSRRRRSWSSDTESVWSGPHTRSPSRPLAPTHPRTSTTVHVAAPKPAKSAPEKPPHAPAASVKTQRTHAIIPTLAANTYDKATYKSIAVKKNGRRYAEGHTGIATDRPRIVAWAKPARRDLKPEGINTLQD